jgi:hypothetical protein
MVVCKHDASGATGYRLGEDLARFDRAVHEGAARDGEEAVEQRQAGVEQRQAGVEQQHAEDLDWLRAELDEVGEHVTGLSERLGQGEGGLEAPG